MKVSIGALMVLAALSLLPIACNGNSNPSAPSNPPAPTVTFTSTNTPCASCTPTFTPTVTFTSSPTFSPTPTPTSGIFWHAAEIYRHQTLGGATNLSAYLWLLVNGSPEATATVYLTGSGIGSTPVTIPYASNQIDTGVT